MIVASEWRVRVVDCRSFKSIGHKMKKPAAPHKIKHQVILQMQNV